MSENPPQNPILRVVTQPVAPQPAAPVSIQVATPAPMPIASPVEQKPVPVAVILDNLDLAALIASRVCHDVISPVGAIINGLEVLETDKDPSMREFAMDLIKKSARNASMRLQFCRLAFGAAGSAGSSIDTRDAHNVSQGFFVDDRTSLEWLVPPAYIAKNRVKLLLNILVMATAAIPRGGKMRVALIGMNQESGFIVESTGKLSRIPPNVETLLKGIPPEGTVIDAHSVQPYYTGLLARASNMNVTVTQTEGSILFRAE
jgi:histidine phosphotransferase ChpT